MYKYKQQRNNITYKCIHKYKQQRNNIIITPAMYTKLYEE